jgi:myosin heavy subunit
MAGHLRQVVKQGPGERNYHVLEMLLAGLDASARQACGLHLNAADEWKYGRAHAHGHAHGSARPQAIG